MRRGEKKGERTGSGGKERIRRRRWAVLHSGPTKEVAEWEDYSNTFYRTSWIRKKDGFEFSITCCWISPKEPEVQSMYFSKFPVYLGVLIHSTPANGFI